MKKMKTGPLCLKQYPIMVFMKRFGFLENALSKKIRRFGRSKKVRDSDVLEK